MEDEIDSSPTVVAASGDMTSGSVVAESRGRIHSDLDILFQGTMTFHKAADEPIRIIIVEHHNELVRSVEIVGLLCRPGDIVIEAPHLFAFHDRLYGKVDKNEINIRIALKLKNTAANRDSSQPNSDDQTKLFQKYRRELAVHFILSHLEVTSYQPKKGKFEIALKPKNSFEMILNPENNKYQLDILMEKPDCLETVVTWCGKGDHEGMAIDEERYNDSTVH
jgi:hypothetical protein